MKRSKSNLLLAAALLFTVVGTIVYDARSHFDQELVELKIKHRSAQRHWSAHFSQQQVFFNSSFRYQQDFSQIAPLLGQDSLVLSDLATSYYTSAVLPAYVINIHRHHGRNARRYWSSFVAEHNACYFERETARDDFLAALKRHRRQLKPSQLPLNYFILNKDKRNRNLRDDCLALRSQSIMQNLDWIAELEFAGEYLNLYRFK